MFKKLMFSLLGASLLLVGCAPDEMGNSDSSKVYSSIDQSGKTKVTLWAWGDAAEVNVFQDLIYDYNVLSPNIYVDFVKKPSNSYYSGLEVALTGRQGPDIFYVGDSMVKRYAKSDYLQDLTSYISQSSEIELDDIWATLMERYQFDVNTYQSNNTAPIWGLPKDIGPTVLFYNEDAMLAKGITVISAFDDNNDGLVTFNNTDYPALGYDSVNKVFNNKIAMIFEESDALTALLSSGSTKASLNQTKWGFYSSWWFYAGWSVGGDCIQFVESNDPTYNGGYWEFTLQDNHPNYKVLNNVSVNGHNYTPNSFIDYYDLDYMATNETNTTNLINENKIVKLPSIREMFEYWITNFQNNYSPKPRDITNELSLFTNQEVAMFVTGRYNVVEFRKSANFAWDVAPLPKHQLGIEAGHSGSMCISMSKKSQVKNEAFTIIEYLAGKTGQDALAKTGFNVPNQISLASNVTKNFLASTERPYNNEIFLRAAGTQKGGDWTYLADDAWIEIWAPTLNSDVLNGTKTVVQLFSTYLITVNEALKKYTKK
jgi:multiple sugar transport system substrate-binding protein